MVVGMVFTPVVNVYILCFIILIIFGLWFYQTFYLFRNLTRSGRKVTRFGLITFLTLVLLGFLLQPGWERETAGETVLIVPMGTSNERASVLKDSLNIKNFHYLQEYEGRADSVYLYGQDYEMEELHLLGGSIIQWIPSVSEEDLTFVQWNGLMRLGENQIVKGSISGDGPFHVQLLEQGSVLAGDSLLSGVKDFQMQFRTKILGRNNLSLLVNGHELGELNYFVIPAAPIQYSLSFGYPNPEGRFLSEYLVRRGDEARVSSQVSRELRIELGLIKGNNESKVWIIDSSQLDQNSLLEDLKDENAAILIINLTDPLIEIPRINQRLGTSFAVDQIGEEPRDTGLGVTAAPFEFKEATHQRIILDETFAYQMVGTNKVGISLLNATFPLMIAGDSIEFIHIWESVLAPFAPVEAKTVQLQQPVFYNIPSRISVLEVCISPNAIRIGRDSLFLQGSVVNDATASGEWIPKYAGWKILNDSLEIYSYGPEELRSVHQMAMVSNFLQAFRNHEKEFKAREEISQIPDWIWLILILLAFGLVWIEPRI